MSPRVAKEASRETSSSKYHYSESLSRPLKLTNNRQSKIAEEKKLNIKGSAQTPNKLWLRNPKNPNFTAPTPGLEIVYFRFKLTQDAVGFVETKDNMEKYAVVSYKHSSEDVGKSMDYMEDP